MHKEAKVQRYEICETLNQEGKYTTNSIQVVQKDWHEMKAKRSSIKLKVQKKKKIQCECNNILLTSLDLDSNQI